MKLYSETRKMYFLLFVILGWAAAMAAVRPVHSQSIKEKGRVKSQSGYAYSVCEKIALSLEQGCSAVAGRIVSEGESAVTFAVEERLTGEAPTSNLVELVYSKPGSSVRLNSEDYSPWTNVEVRKDKKLILFYCGGKSGLRQTDYVSYLYEKKVRNR